MFKHDNTKPETSTVSGAAYSGNPIVVTNPQGAQGSTTDPKAWKFRVDCGGRTVYEGRWNWPLSPDISAVVDAVVPDIREAEEDDYYEYFCTAVEEADTFDGERLIELFVEGANSPEPLFAAYCFRGGMSAPELEAYADRRTDVFAARLLNIRSNFFMTSRTAGAMMTIRETEIGPLYFLNDGSVRELDCHTTDGRFGNLNDRLTVGVWAFDLEGYRRHLFLTEGVLCNRFQFRLSAGRPLTVVISRADVVPERYRLKFRNRFGVFEYMELPAALKLSGQAAEEEQDGSYSRYNAVTGCFDTLRRRMPRRTVITAENVPLCSDSRGLLADMLGSSEVYLLDLYARPLRVHPEVEELEYAAIPEEPATYTLTLTQAGGDCWPGDLTDLMAARKARDIFSSEFSDEFE
ncbi:MAG: hypothetical protein K2I56_07275 [Muribaculaceae bacterium]|nr:hypothetical protein [Muribaculaceae bacterium]